MQCKVSRVEYDARALSTSTVLENVRVLHVHGALKLRQINAFGDM